MLKIIDLIPQILEMKSKFKVHLAIGRVNKYEPLYELAKDKFKEWQEYQNNKNFERNYIFSLIYYKPDEWIFGGIYERINVKEAYDKKRQKNYWNYDTKLLDIHKDLIGRMIIYFKKAFRQSYVLLEKYVDTFIISEIFKKPYRIEPFPGFENLIIDFSFLKEIIKEEEPTWKTALSNIKGIYLITDKKNGKLYVGSAYGENAFWSRWCQYAINGHGNNIELKKIIKEYNYEYAYNFQFSILEVRSAIVEDELIIKRESHWKNVLLTKEFGYNEN